MSFILNALRKSEQERQNDQPETLENKIQAQVVETEQKKRPWLVIVLVMINLIFLVFLFWYFNQTENESKPEPAAEKVPVLTEPQANKQSKRIPPPTPTVEQQDPILSTDSISERKRLIQERIAQYMAKRKAEAKNNKLPTKKEPPVINSAAEINRPNHPAQVAKKAENDPPFLSELDYDFRRNVPDFEINVFVYSEQPENRFIMVNMKKFVPGQDLIPGLKLKEIRMNSIVVEYRNKVFQIKR